MASLDIVTTITDRMTSLFKPLTIGISTSALFDLREEHGTYVNDGIDAYRRLQLERRQDPMKPGTAFHVIQKLLAINTPGEKPRVEVALISRNNIETGIRARYSLDHHRLDIPRIALTGGQPVESSLLKAYGIDLFLSRHADDVQRAVDGDIAAFMQNISSQHYAIAYGNVLTELRQVGQLLDIEVIVT